MSDTWRSGYEATIVALAPVVLLGALVAHPYLPGRLPNAAAVAEAVAADTTRWGLVHVATAVASALVVLAFLALRDHLREAGDQRLSAVGVPFIVIGSTLFAMLPGMEFAALAAAEAQTDIAAAQTAVQPWFVPVLFLGGLIFAIGVLAFIRALTVTAILGRTSTAVVVAALGVMAVSRLVPLTAAQFYLQSAAAVLAFGPLAYHMWRYPNPRTAAGTELG